MHASPALQSLSCEGHIIAVLENLGRACPQVSALCLDADDSQLPDIHYVMPLVPSMFLNLSCLTLQGGYNSVTNRQRPDKQLPDMSALVTIRYLCLSDCTFSFRNQWLCLPPRLDHLKCRSMESGPQVSVDGKHILSKLRVLEVTGEKLRLHSLAELLRVAPLLRNLKYVSYLHIDCDLNVGTNADLLLLHGRASINGIKWVHFCIDCSVRIDVSVMQVLAGLPDMPRFRICDIKNCRREYISTLVKAFPNVRELLLESSDDINSVDLQELVSFRMLSTLSLSKCKMISPAGLLGLALRKRPLQVHCYHCPLMKNPALKECLRILARNGAGVSVDVM